MRRQALADPEPDLLGKLRVARNAVLQHHIGLDDLGAQRVRLADRGRQCHRRMAGQAILDLARPDAESGGCDDVVVAAEEIEITVLVLDTLVAGGHPVADELLRRGLGILPVFQEHHRVGPGNRDLAGFARFHPAPVLADDGDLVARHCAADRAGPADADRAAGSEHQIAFRLAVELVDRQAEFRTRPLIGFAPERFAARADRAQIEPEPPGDVRERFSACAVPSAG